MGSGACWFKSACKPKKAKEDRHKQTQHSGKKSNGDSGKNVKTRELTENDAAIRIQSAFRAYRARKALRRLKVIVRYRQVIEDGHAIKKQAFSALDHIHFWSRIQAEIRARWLDMVTDARTRQKKLENQLKLEAKLHELEVEWCGGPETMEEVLSRIQQREEAAAKRERAMAYAFSHQWRANSNQFFGQAYYDLGKESWGWSWKERWIAVRPWENRIQPKHSLTTKREIKHQTSAITNATLKKPVISLKPILTNGKVPKHAKKLSKVTQDQEAAT